MGASRTPKQQTSPTCKLSAAKGFIFRFSSRLETWRTDGAGHLWPAPEEGRPGLRRPATRARRQTVAPRPPEAPRGGDGGGGGFWLTPWNRPLAPLALRYQRPEPKEKRPAPAAPNYSGALSFWRGGYKRSRGTRCGLWLQGSA